MPVNDKNSSNERGLGLSHTRRPARLVATPNNNTEITEEMGDIRSVSTEASTSNVRITRQTNNSNVIVRESSTTVSSKESVVADVLDKKTATVAPVDISEDVGTRLEDSLIDKPQAKKTTAPDSSSEVDSSKPELAPPLIPDAPEQPSVSETAPAATAAADSHNLEIIRKAKQAAADVRRLESRVTNVREDDTLWIRVASTPSNGKVYDSTDSVFYRKYTYGDYEDINNADLPLRDKYALSLQGMRVDTLDSKLLLPFCDFSYLNILRRLEAQGARKFSIPYVCNTCGQIGAHIFTLDQINFKTCDLDLPIRVRFRSYPDEIFEFNLITIGDVLTLMDDDNYYRKEKNGEYKVTISGNFVVDRLAVLCSACVSHKYREAYTKLNQINNDQDFRTLTELRSLLNPGLAPMEFKCSLSLPKHDDPEKIEQENEKKMDALRDSKGELPAFLKLVRERRSNKICEAKNTVNVEGGDVVVLPFREHTDDNEYGILSQQV